MSEPFNPQQGLVIITATVSGPGTTANIRVAVDTAATMTTISKSVLIYLGFDPDTAPQQRQLITASGTTLAPEVLLTSITALGHTRIAFPVISVTFPAGANIDEVLGLDFMRGHELRINFRVGLVALL